MGTNAKAGVSEEEAQRRVDKGTVPPPESSKSERTDPSKPSKADEGRSPPMRGGSSQGSGDRAGLSGGTDTDRPVGRPPQPRPGEG